MSVGSVTKLGGILSFELLWATFYLTIFHLFMPQMFFVGNLRFQMLFEVDAFKLIFNVDVSCIFGHFFPKIGRNFNQFSGRTGCR